MELTVSKRSQRNAETGNCVLTLVGNDETIKTALGNKVKKHKYYISVIDDEQTPEQGEVLDIELSEFKLTKSPYTFTNEAGEEVTTQLNWLSL